MFMLSVAIRKLALPVSVLAFAAINASASPVLCTSAGTLQALINDGSCQYYDKIFSNFLFNFQGGTSNNQVASPLVPAATDVGTAFSSPSGFGAYGNPVDPTLTFTFNANNTVGPYQNLVLTIQYQVDIAPTENAKFTGMSGSATGAYTTSQTVSDVSGSHTLTPGGHPLQMQKYACINGAFDMGNAPFPSQLCDGSDSATVVNTGNFSYSGANLSLTNPQTRGGSATYPLSDGTVTTVGAYDAFTIFGGTTSDGKGSTTQTAKALSMSNSFIETDSGLFTAPEPAPMVLIGASLFGLGYFRRKKRF